MARRDPDALTPEQVRSLRIDAKRELADLRKRIARAKRATLDTTELEATADRYEQLIDGLLREYGPRGGGVA